MLLHPRFDVVVLVPHAHLDAVGGVVTLAVDFLGRRLCQVKKNNHGYTDAHSYSLFIVGVQCSVERDDSPMHEYTFRDLFEPYGHILHGGQFFAQSRMTNCVHFVYDLSVYA